MFLNTELVRFLHGLSKLESKNIQFSNGFEPKKNPDFEWSPKSEPLDNRTDVYHLKTGQVKVLYLVVSSNQASGYLDPSCVMTLLVPGIWLFFFSTNYR